MLDNGFGVDPLSGNSALPAAYGTNAGNLYCKPGDWHDGNTKRDEQTLAYFLPQDMELAVFINSPVAGQIGTNNFRYVVTMAYLNSLVPPQPTRLI